MPAEVGKLTNLKELHMEGNRLVELPAEVYSLMIAAARAVDIVSCASRGTALCLLMPRCSGCRCIAE